MKTYPKYKPTNIDWIGEIPEHWSNRKVAWSFNLIGSGTTPKSDSELYYENGNHNWLLTGDLTDGEIYETSKKVTDLALKETSSLKKYPINSIVMAMYGATIGKLGILKIETTTNQACCVLADSPYFNFKYVFYWMLSSRESIINLSYGGGQPNINQDIVKGLKLTYPPLPEQQAIVTYLDQKSTLIDELIAKKERKIELLKENRTALINQAVTKGLNPTVKYKDSGIEWIGEIPEHWSLVKVGHLTRIIRGASPRPAGDPLLFDGDFINWVTVGSVTNSVGKYVWETETFLTEAGMIQSRVVEPETLLISNSGATLGVPKILKIKGCINDGSVAFLDLKSNLERDFLYYFLVSQTDLLREQQSGYGQPNLNTDIIANIRFPLPTIMEQKEVVEFLDSNLEIYDQNINLELQKIEKLREYRQSLISNVVTGKICVLED